MLRAVSLSSAYTGKVYLKMQFTVTMTVPTLADRNNVCSVYVVLTQVAKANTATITVEGIFKKDFANEHEHFKKVSEMIYL